MSDDLSLDRGIVTRADFNPLIRPYLVLSIALSLAITIIGLPLALLWICGIGQWWSRHYFDRLECELDARQLRYRKGILFQVEKTIPLENIQDVTFVEGPILKRFDLAILKFETAGQSAGQANDMRLIGIIDAHEFRNRILAARRRLRDAHAGVSGGVSSSAPAADLGAAQLAALQGIERKLDAILVALERQGRSGDSA